MNDKYEFATVAARITELPPKSRPAAKEAARRAVDADRSLAACARAVFGVLIEALYWEKGTTTRIGREDLVLQTKFNRSSVSRALKQLSERGHILIQQTQLRADYFEKNAYTFPNVAACMHPEEVQ